MRIILIILMLIGLAALIYLTFYYFWIRRVPTPSYQVDKQAGKIEIRTYPAMLVAQVKIKGERSPAINQGFRILADYIFGNNIAMTAPVTQQKSEDIAMTAPVLQQAEGEVWAVSFIMPPNYTLVPRQH